MLTPPPPPPPPPKSVREEHWLNLTRRIQHLREHFVMMTVRRLPAKDCLWGQLKAAAMMTPCVRDEPMDPNWLMHQAVAPVVIVVISYFLVAIHHSPSTTHHPPLTIHHSPSTTLTIH